MKYYDYCEGCDEVDVRCIVKTAAAFVGMALVLALLTVVWLAVMVVFDDPVYDVPAAERLSVE